MVKINLSNIKKILPDKTEIRLLKYNGHQMKKGRLIIQISFPRKLSKDDIILYLEKAQGIIGSENIFEMEVKEDNKKVLIFMKNIPTRFIELNN